MPELSPKLIVIVDDSEIFCRQMRQFLEDRYGERVRVETYSDPLKGLASLNPNIALLIVDLEMPAIDGKKFLSFAIQKGVNPKRIIIASFQNADILHQKFKLSDCLAVMDKNEPEQQQAFRMIADSIVKH